MQVTLSYLVVWTRPRNQRNGKGNQSQQGASGRSRGPMLDGDNSPAQKAPPVRARNPKTEGDESPVAALEPGKAYS